MFCVTRPRLDDAVLEQCGRQQRLLPACVPPSGCVAKKPKRNNAPITTRASASQPFVSACMIPNTTSTGPSLTAPRRPHRSGASDRRHGIDDRPAEEEDDATITAWKTNAARQLIAVVISPPISGPAAAPMPPMPLITPKARARDWRSSKSIVVRMYTGGISSAVPTPSKIEFPMMSTPRPGDTALDERADPVEVSPMVKHRFRPHRSVNLPPGNHQRRHHQQEQRDRDLHAVDGRVRSSLMSVIITFMFEPAKLQMNCASASGISICRRPGEAGPADGQNGRLDRQTAPTDGAPAADRDSPPPR